MTSGGMLDVEAVVRTLRLEVVEPERFHRRGADPDRDRRQAHGDHRGRRPSTTTVAS